MDFFSPTLPTPNNNSSRETEMKSMSPRFDQLRGDRRRPPETDSEDQDLLPKAQESLVNVSINDEVSPMVRTKLLKGWYLRLPPHFFDFSHRSYIVLLLSYVLVYISTFDFLYALYARYSISGILQLAVPVVCLPLTALGNIPYAGLTSLFFGYFMLIASCAMSCYCQLTDDDGKFLSIRNPPKKFYAYIVYCSFLFITYTVMVIQVVRKTPNADNQGRWEVMYQYVRYLCNVRVPRKHVQALLSENKENFFNDLGWHNLKKAVNRWSLGFVRFSTLPPSYVPPQGKFPVPTKLCEGRDGFPVPYVVNVALLSSIFMCATFGVMMYDFIGKMFCDPQSKEKNKDLCSNMYKYYLITVSLSGGWTIACCIIILRRAYFGVLEISRGLHKEKRQFCTGRQAIHFVGAQVFPILFQFVVLFFVAFGCTALLTENIISYFWSVFKEGVKSYASFFFATVIVVEVLGTVCIRDDVVVQSTLFSWASPFIGGAVMLPGAVSYFKSLVKQVAMVIFLHPFLFVTPWGGTGAVGQNAHRSFWATLFMYRECTHPVKVTFVGILACETTLQRLHEHGVETIGITEFRNYFQHPAIGTIATWHLQMLIKNNFEALRAEDSGNNNKSENSFPTEAMPPWFVLNVERAYEIVLRQRCNKIRMRWNLFCKLATNPSLRLQRKQLLRETTFLQFTSLSGQRSGINLAGVKQTNKL